MIRYRPLNWPHDAGGLARLDTSFSTTLIYRVEASELSFSLVEQAIEPPLRKQYFLARGDFASAAHTVVAEFGRRIIGVAALAVEEWNRRAVIFHLYVDRSARGQGVGGSLLLWKMEQRARTLGARCIWLEAQNVNSPAIRFYQRYGFVCCGIDTMMYGREQNPGEVAIFLALPLDRSPVR